MMFLHRLYFWSLTFILFLLLSGGGTVQAQKIWTLEDCINYALENNLDIQKQILMVESNKKTLLQSALSMLPDLNANGTNVWNFGQTIDQYTNTFATNTVRSNNFYLQSGVTLFNGLQKINTLKKNQINVLASKYDLDVMKNNISLAVAGYYLDILFNGELQEVAKQQLAITTSQVDRIDKMVAAGASAKGDLLNIQAQKAAEELSLVEAENKLNISYLSLQQLIDLEVTHNFQVEKPALKLVEAPQGLITPEVIYEHALKARPEVQAAELRVQSAQKTLAIARGTLYPSLTFAGSWGTGYSGAAQEIDPTIAPVITMEKIGITQFSRDTVLGYYRNYSTRITSFSDQLHQNENQSLGFYLRVPIFNGWSSRNSISQAKINRSQAELDLGIKKRDLRKLIEQAYADAVASLQKYNSSEEKVTAQEESFKYTQQKFDVGMMTSFDYNNSKKDLTKAQSDLLQAKYDFIFKTTILDFYMGNPIRINRE
ncbi:MAG: TolC family protein [Bacteroidales bacterium]|nr:TolC family protein [Bacteroidales bacterium]